MADLRTLSKQSVIDIIDYQKRKHSRNDKVMNVLEDISRELRLIPDTERLHGHWIIRYKHGKKILYCSRCKQRLEYQTQSSLNPRFCGYCDAIMDEVIVYDK